VCEQRRTSWEGGDDRGEGGLNVRDQGLHCLERGGERGHVRANKRDGSSGQRNGTLGGLEGAGDAREAGENGWDNVEGAVALNSGD
jgi:hypothetical protein